MYNCGDNAFEVSDAVLTVRQPVSTIDKADVGLALLWLVRAGLAAALATPLIVAPDAYFPFVVGKAVYSRSIIEATFALWVALVIFYPRYRPGLSWVLIAFCVWFAVSWLAGAFGVSYVRSMWSTYERMQGLVDLAHWLAFASMAATAFSGLRGWRVLFTINLIVGIVVCSLGLLSFYDLIQSESLGVGGGRLAATMGNPTYLAAYAAVNALIGAGLLVRSFAPGSDGGVGRRRAGSAFSADGWLRPVWAVAVVLSLWALWETASRGAALGLAAAVAGLAVFYALRGARTPRARKAALAVIAAFAAVALLFAAARTSKALDPLMQSSRMTARLAIVGDDTDRSLRGRLVAFRAGVTAFAERPLLGWGSENFLSAWGRHTDYEESGIETRFDRAHSKIIEEMVTKGAAGLAAYIFVWAAMAWALIRSYRRRRGLDRAFIAIVGAAMVAYFIQNLFLFDNFASTLQFSLLAAFAASEERRERTRSGEKRDTDGAKPARTRWTQRFGFGLGGVLRSPTARRFGLGGVLRSPTATRLRSALGSAPAGAALAIGVAALMLALIFAANMRIYAAAVSVRQAEVQLEWTARADYYLAAFNAFPGLANYPRKLLAYDLSHRLADMSDQDFARAVEMVSSAGADGIADEPTDWVLEASLASFFQRAATRDPTLLETAAAHVDRALALAPRAKEPLNARREQERLEKFFANLGGR